MGKTRRYDPRDSEYYDGYRKRSKGRKKTKMKHGGEWAQVRKQKEIFLNDPDLVDVVEK